MKSSERLCPEVMYLPVVQNEGDDVVPFAARVHVEKLAQHATLERHGGNNWCCLKSRGSQKRRLACERVAYREMSKDIRIRYGRLGRLAAARYDVLNDIRHERWQTGAERVGHAPVIDVAGVCDGFEQGLERI